MKKPGPRFGGPGLKFVSRSLPTATQDQGESAEAE